MTKDPRALTIDDSLGPYGWLVGLPVIGALVEASEHRERARIVAWLREHGDGDVWADEIEMGSHVPGA